MDVKEIEPVLQPKQVKDTRECSKTSKAAQTNLLMQKKKCKYVEIKGVPLPQCFARRKNPTALPFSRFLPSLSPGILRVDASQQSDVRDASQVT